MSIVLVSNPTSPYPVLSVDTTGTSVVSHAGAVLLHTAEKTGLTRALSEELFPWRKTLAVHDPAKVVLDLAVSLAVGGNCLADIAVLREQSAVFGHVASDPIVSRTIDALAARPTAALAAINTARAHARNNGWSAAGEGAPDHDINAANPLVIDLDATLVTAHSGKESAAATYKRGFGHHPLLAFVDHGNGGTGEPVAALLRPGNAGSDTVADHKTVVREALAQLPAVSGYRVGRKVLVRTDGAGGTHGFLEYLTQRRVSYSVGFALNTTLAGLINQIPKHGWTPAYNSDEMPRDGAWVAELTEMADLSTWPDGMRLIVRKERPDPGAQLRFTVPRKREVPPRDGLRVTAFVTNTRDGQTGELELRHRQRARCEDRIRNTKATGLAGLPLHDFAQNQIWLAIVSLTAELTAWMQTIALADHDARAWDPKRLRLRIYSVAARIATHARRTWLRLSAHAPWSGLIAHALARLNSVPALP